MTAPFARAERHMGEGLLPCPFCGGEAYLDRNPTVNGGMFCEMVVCKNGCVATFFCATEAEAAELWNTRAIPRASDEVLADASGVFISARALVRQVKAVIWRLNGQAYSSTLSAVNELDARLKAANPVPVDAPAPDAQAGERSNG